MLFASMRSYFIDQIARYKYHRIQKVLSKASIRLQKLHDENQDFEALYQSLKSQQQTSSKTNFVLILSTEKNKRKKRNFSLFKSKHEQEAVFNAKYPSADDNFKALYLRQHAIKNQYNQKLKTTSKYCQRNIKWIKRYEKKNKISDFTYLEKIDHIISTYDKARKNLNFCLKKTPELNHEYASRRVPFYSKIRITAAFFRAPKQQQNDIEIERSCLLNRSQHMENKAKAIYKKKRMDR